VQLQWISRSEKGISAMSNFAQKQKSVQQKKPPNVSRRLQTFSGKSETGESKVATIVREILRSPGKSLDAETRAFMEPRFSHDFSRVKVHDDSRATASARAVNALAFTVGPHITFDSGRYSPGTMPGRHLLAHELAHVVQQNFGRVSGFSPELTVETPGSSGEQEADIAADRVILGKTAAIRQSSENLRLQKAEHGTYVSTKGDQAYLDAGYEFYDTWGHPNVLRVSTMQDILTDLNKSSGTIDTFRIVSHASSFGLRLGLLPELSPDYFGTNAAQFVDETAFRRHFTGMRLVSDTLFTTVLNALRSDAITGPFLTTLGVGPATPNRDSEVGILLRAILETEFLNKIELDTGGAPVIANRRILDQFNQNRSTKYKDLLVSNAAASNRKDVKNAISRLTKELPRVMSAAGIQFGTITQNEADTMADPFTDQTGKKPRMLPEISKSITEGAGGPYLKDLHSVKSKINTDTHVEIRGCNIGNNPTMLDSIRRYFGNTGALPRISAPDLFQYFFKLNYQTYQLNNPSEMTKMQGAYTDPDTGLAQGLEDAGRIAAKEMTRVFIDSTLSTLSKRYGLDVTRLTNLNPEIDPNNLLPGQAIWLVQRTEVQAGRYRNLADLCGDYIGNKYEWPSVWGANPSISDASKLNKTDRIKFPDKLLTFPVATPAPTFADLETRLRSGSTVMAIHTTKNRPVLHMQHTGSGPALANWLAAQRFDPRGRTAKVLGKLYAGKKFTGQADKTYIQFLSHSYPTIQDPIFPEDFRYRHHIIHRP
jgi:hypothetical protein